VLVAVVAGVARGGYHALSDPKLERARTARRFPASASSSMLDAWAARQRTRGL
jgi:hypothetical protein